MWKNNAYFTHALDLFILHLSLQYFTSSQTFTHFFRHVKGLEQTRQIFDGKSVFFMFFMLIFYFFGSFLKHFLYSRVFLKSFFLHFLLYRFFDNAKQYHLLFFGILQYPQLERDSLFQFLPNRALVPSCSFSKVRELIQLEPALIQVTRF